MWRSWGQNGGPCQLGREEIGFCYKENEMMMRSLRWGLPWGHSSWWKSLHGNIKDLEYFCPFVDRTLMHSVVSMLDTGWQLQEFTCFVFHKLKFHHFWNKKMLKKLHWMEKNFVLLQEFQHSEVICFKKYNFNIWCCKDN